MSDHTLLLGGAERKHTRVRGFAEWSPHRKTRALLVHDDGGAIHKPVSYRSAGEFLATVRWRAERFRLDRTAGQECRLAVICEASGMVPQLSRVTDPYGVTVMSSGGFDSTTDRHAFAAELAEHDRPTEVLHIGDHDPSGTHMFLAFLEDVEAFARELGGAAHKTCFPRQSAAQRSSYRNGLGVASLLPSSTVNLTVARYRCVVAARADPMGHAPP
jgi:hypothetical protein